MHVAHDVEEVHDVSVEASNRAGGDEAEDLHSTVVADVEVPFSVGGLNSSDGASDGVNVAELSEPRTLD